MIGKFAIAALSLVAAAQSAHASSDKAWDALFAKVNGTCIGQSRMVSPEASAPIVFDDAAGKVAVLLRESAGKGKSKTNVICLYDKKTGRASIAEYHWLSN